MNITTKIDCIDCDKTIEVLDRLITHADVNAIEDAGLTTICKDDINSRNITVTYDSDVELWYVTLSIGGVCTNCLRKADTIPTYE